MGAKLKKNILIFGASGAIGNEVYNYLKRFDLNIFGTFKSNKKNKDLIFCDLDNNDSIIEVIKSTSPDYILFLSGLKNLQTCSNSLDHAITANCLPIKKISIACEKFNLNPQFFYLSTDYVFEGNEGSYNYESDCHPKSNYGLSKYLGEKLALEFFKENTIILRTSAVMIKEKGFLGWLEKNLIDNRKIEIFDNIIFTPTSSKSLCVFFKELIEDSCYLNKIKPVVHFSSGIEISKFQFTLRWVEKNYPEKASLIFPKNIVLKESEFFPNLSICTLQNKTLDNSTIINMETFM